MNANPLEFVYLCTDCLFEAHSGVLWRFPQSVGQSPASLRIFQLNGLDATYRRSHITNVSTKRFKIFSCIASGVRLTCVVKVSGPLVVVGQFRKH